MLIGERRLWGGQALAAVVVALILSIGLAAWPLSRRLLQAHNDAGDAREHVLATVSTAAVAVAAGAGVLGALIGAARPFRRGEPVSWRPVLAATLFAVCVAAFILAGGNITGMFG